MNKSNCLYEKISLRTLGIVLLPFVVFFGVVANMVLPVFGTFFVLPFLFVSLVLIKAPRSKTCRLLLGDQI